MQKDKEMTFLENFKLQLDYAKSDLKAYLSKSGSNNVFHSFIYLLTCHGWHIIVFFRIGKIIYSIEIPIVSHLLRLIFRLFWFLLTTFYGISLNLLSEIGKGFYIGHYGTIFVRATIGENCSIAQGVTMGSKGAGKSDGWPTIGDNVYIGSGAKIIGNITIGNNVIIGANCVVLRDIPDNSLAVGVPAKVKPLSN